MDDLNISRRDVLKNTAVAGVAGGLFANGSFSAAASANAPKTIADLGIEFLEGREKWSLVRDAIRSEKFRTVYERLRTRGWTPSFSDVDAFSVERDIEYEGIVLGFDKQDAPAGTGATFVHLQGDLPDDLDRRTFGHIGRKSADPAIADTQLYATEETYIVPEEDGSVRTETDSFDPKKDSDVQSLLAEDEYTTADKVCQICFQDCTIGWKCAMTIVMTGISIIGCTVGTVSSGGIAFALCVGPVLWGLYSSYDCITSRDCQLTSTNVTESQYRDWKQENNKVTSPTFEDYCERWSC